MKPAQGLQYDLNSAPIQNSTSILNRALLSVVLTVAHMLTSKQNPKGNIQA